MMKKHPMSVSDKEKYIDLCANKIRNVINKLDTIDVDEILKILNKKNISVIYDELKHNDVYYNREKRVIFIGNKPMYSDTEHKSDILLYLLLFAYYGVFYKTNVSKALPGYLFPDNWHTDGLADLYARMVFQTHKKILPIRYDN